MSESMMGRNQSWQRPKWDIWFVPGHFTVTPPNSCSQCQALGDGFVRCSSDGMNLGVGFIFFLRFKLSLSAGTFIT